MKLTFHHTGIVVDHIDEAIAHYSLLFGAENVSEKYFIASQDVNVCLVHTGNHVFIELIEPASPNSVVKNLRKKGISYYHVAYLTPDIEEAVEKLAALKYKPLKYFESEAFQGKRCIFLFSSDAHLVELIEE